MDVSFLVHLLIDLVVAGVVLWIAWIILNAIPMFAPFKQVAMAILTLIAVLILVSMLLPLLGSGGGGALFHSRC